MRVPDFAKDCVAFLCVKERRDGVDGFHYGGTAFFVSMPSEKHPDTAYITLVTARHNIQKAERYGALYLRVNTLEGKTETLEINGQWIYPDNDAVDLAIIPIDYRFARFNIGIIPAQTFLTRSIIKQLGVGIGDDLIIVGLFTQRHGANRNLPIVRMGNIASMPDEPLEDERTGLEYDAYLAEMRSIGGLSGSPVFVVKPIGKAEPMFTGYVFLLGLIRGHWDLKSKEGLVDFSDSELQAVNMGIATVTPIEELIKLLMRDDVVKLRREADRRPRKERSGTTLDTAFPEPSTQATDLHKEFEDMLKRVSRETSEPEA